MKKLPKRIWIWILSGLSVILGGCSDVSCLYGPPKVYGPPPPEVKNHIPENDSIQTTIEQPENESNKDEEGL